jgi:hypothetical protein
MEKRVNLLPDLTKAARLSDAVSLQSQTSFL